MFERIRKWQDESRQRSKIAQLSDFELRDLAMSRDDLESMVGIGPEVNQRQMTMAHRHGLGEQDLRRHPQDLVASTRACAHCGHIGECARFLASDAPVAASAAFCPNHVLYEQLAQH